MQLEQLHQNWLENSCINFLLTLRYILAQFPSCKVPLARLLEHLPPLQPRYYSTSCSPLQFPNQVHIAFNVLKFSNARGEEVTGLCTSWLEQLCEPLISGQSNAGKNVVYINHDKKFMFQFSRNLQATSSYLLMIKFLLLW